MVGDVPIPQSMAPLLLPVSSVMCYDQGWSIAGGVEWHSVKEHSFAPV